MTRCAVTEDLDRHMAELDKDDRRADALDEKAAEVEEKFTELANGPDGIAEAFYWLGGVFNEELMSAAISYLFGDGNNKNFEDAIEAKAEELLEADCAEPDAPDDYDRL